MAYCTAQDITALTGNPYRDESDSVQGTNPSLSDLNGYLEMGANDINAKLDALGIETPIIEGDTPRSFAIAKKLNIYFGMHWASQHDGTVEDAVMYKTMYDDEIEMIERGKTSMDDTETDGDEPTLERTSPAKYNFDTGYESDQVTLTTRF